MGNFLVKSNFRNQSLYFSFPLLETHVAILVRSESVRFQLSAFLSNLHVWTTLALTVLTLIAAGHIFWLFERHANPALRDHYHVSISRSIWWSCCTISTVGYGGRDRGTTVAPTVASTSLTPAMSSSCAAPGDIVPVTRGGRAFAMLYMIMGVLLATGARCCLWCARRRWHSSLSSRR